MLRGLRLAAVLVTVGSLQAGLARAQWGTYPGGYGGWGWGGWGGQTVLGSEARGMGVFAAGVGAYNVQTAQARSINLDTVMRWNQWLYNSQLIRNQKHYHDLQQEKYRNIQGREKIFAKIRDNPSQDDVWDGDALNLILDQLTNPKVYVRAVQSADTHLSHPIVQDIPFTYASEAVTISLDELNDPGDWPLPMRGEEFANQRAAYDQAVKHALEQDEKGTLSEEAIGQVREAVTGLWAQVEKIPDERDRLQSEQHVKALAGMVRMLRSPDVQPVLAELEKYQGATVGDLLSFMHSFNLRFGPAQTGRQRNVYDELYPILSRTRDEVLGPMNDESLMAMPTPPEERDGEHPAQFFQGMDWRDLNAKHVPVDPNAAAPADGKR